HSGPGGEAVIHTDDGLSAHIERRERSPISALTALELLLFLADHRLDGTLRNPQAGHDVTVEHQRAARRERAHRKLLAAGDAELAHDEHVQRSTELLRYFVGDRNPASRQGEHEDIGTPRILGKSRREHAAGMTPVPIPAHDLM